MTRTSRTRKPSEVAQPAQPQDPAAAAFDAWFKTMQAGVQQMVEEVSGTRGTIIIVLQILMDKGLLDRAELLTTLSHFLKDRDDPGLKYVYDVLAFPGSYPESGGNGHGGKGRRSRPKKPSIL